MKTKKFRFNIIDVLIILVLVVAAAAAYLLFFGRSSATDPVNEEAPVEAKIRYVLQVNELPAEYKDNIPVGEKVIDYGTHISAGNVTALDSETFVYVGHDKTTGQQKLTPVDGYVNLYVTVEGDALLKDETYFVNDTSVYVGKRLDMMMPDLFCTGQIISLDIIE